MTLTLTHSHAGGTMLLGTAKYDGSAEVLKTRPGGSYWKWSRNLGAWFIVRSRDALPNRYRINQTAEALRAAGFEVEVDVDDAVRSTAEVVADKRERAGDRADALDAKAARHASAARGAFDAEHAILDAIPSGQPILVGHHSEHRHRNALAKADRLMHKALEHHDTAKDAARRADIARVAAEGKESRRTVENRVKKLRADIARDLRTLHGHWTRWGRSQSVDRDEATGRHVLVFHAVDPDSKYGAQLTTRIVVATEQRHYWSEVLQAMGPPPVSQKPAKGDTVTVRDQTYTVVRASKWGVTVDTGRTDEDGKPVKRTEHRFNVSDWTRADGTPGEGW